MEIDAHISTQLKALRAARGWTLEQLSAASGVSRGMVSKVERCQASATAALLSRLCTALGVTLSDMVSPPDRGGFLVRKGERPRWQDPATGFTREIVSARLTGSAVEVVEVELPPGARVDYQLPTPAGYSQHILALADGLRVHQEKATDLKAGDCLFMSPTGLLSFENTGGLPCRYLVVMERLRRAA